MTATCTPGLPSVVRFLVNSSSLPAPGPFRIWIAASGCTPAGFAAADGDATAVAVAAVIVVASAVAAVVVIAAAPWALTKTLGAAVTFPAAGVRKIMVFSKSLDPVWPAACAAAI